MAPFVSVRHGATGDGRDKDKGTALHPGYGLILPADAHPEVFFTSVGYPFPGREQHHDATFGLQPTDRLVLHAFDAVGRRRRGGNRSAARGRGAERDRHDGSPRPARIPGREVNPGDQKAGYPPMRAGRRFRQMGA
ncbi:immune inhibitor A [Candidatus Binatia bacterium]|nr:immune inhibitor A [Candidatus Binatia bacterium]